VPVPCEACRDLYPFGYRAAGGDRGKCGRCRQITGVRVRDPGQQRYEKRAVTVKGTVTSREYRTYSGIRTLIIYIKTDSVISSSDHSDNLSFSVTDHRSGKNSGTKNNVQTVSTGSTSRGGHYVIACTMDKPVPPKTGSKVLVRGTLSLYDQATNPG
jgi:hypothetical protein